MMDRRIRPAASSRIPFCPSLPPRHHQARVSLERLEPRRLWSASPLPRPDHVVVVVEEDHSYGAVLGPPLIPPQLWSTVLPLPQTGDPYLRQLAANGASFTHAHSVAHFSTVT